MTTHVLRQDKDGLATLTLNRPDKLNALNLDTFAELEAHIETIAGQCDTVGLVVLRGAGKAFSAGADLGDISGGKVPPTGGYQSKVIESLANLPQPVITAVHGHCYTGALELALAGDLIVASHAARFADTHAKWSLTPIWGMSQRLPRRIGRSKAYEMGLTTRRYTGLEALDMGLVNFCWPDSDFDAELQKLCREILAGSWFTHRANKALMAETDAMPLAAGLAHEVFRTAGRGADMQDRIAAFAARSKPKPG